MWRSDEVLVFGAPKKNNPSPGDFFPKPMIPDIIEPAAKRFVENWIIIEKMLDKRN